MQPLAIKSCRNKAIFYCMTEVMYIGDVCSRLSVRETSLAQLLDFKVYLLKDCDPVGPPASRSVGFPKCTMMLG
jgi:hypothetical protein